MNTTSLSSLYLLYINSLDFKNNCFSLDINAGNGSQEFLIKLNHILSFDYSVDSLDDDGHYFSVLEVIHEYRKLVASDLYGYVYFTNDVSTLPKLNIINICGSGKTYNFICKEVEILDAQKAHES
jgi:hypothetical protein